MWRTVNGLTYCNADGERPTLACLHLRLTWGRVACRLALGPLAPTHPLRSYLHQRTLSLALLCQPPRRPAAQAQAWTALSLPGRPYAALRSPPLASPQSPWRGCRRCWQAEDFQPTERRSPWLRRPSQQTRQGRFFLARMRQRPHCPQCPIDDVPRPPRRRPSHDKPHDTRQPLLLVFTRYSPLIQPGAKGRTAATKCGAATRPLGALPPTCSGPRKRSRRRRLVCVPRRGTCRRRPRRFHAMASSFPHALATLFLCADCLSITFSSL